MTIAVDTNYIVGLAGGDEKTIEAHQILSGDHFDLRAPIIATPREIIRYFTR